MNFVSLLQVATNLERKKFVGINIFH